MIAEFVKIWDEFKGDVQEKFKVHPDYSDIVKHVVQMLHDHSDDYDKPDPERITVIDHGHYQGTILFVIGASGYQPSTYWSAFMGYGSCSYCDTLQRIRNDSDWSDETPTEGQVKDYMGMALNVVQGLRLIGEE